MSAAETSPARFGWTRVFFVGVVLGGIVLAANSLACMFIAPPDLSAGPYSELFAEHSAWSPANVLAGATGAVWGFVPALLGYAGMKGRRLGVARVPWVIVAIAYLLYVYWCAAEGVSASVTMGCAVVVLAASIGLAAQLPISSD